MNKFVTILAWRETIINKKEIEALLYTQEAIDFGDYIVAAWFDDQSAEKHIDVFVKKTRKEGGFIPNGMT